MTDPQQPRTDPFPSATPPTDPAVHVQAEPYTGSQPPAEQQPAPSRRGRARVALVAAVAVGLVAVGGGGFAVGRATAPGSTSATTDQQVPGQFGTPPDGGQPGTPPDGGQFGTPPGQDGGTTTEPTT